MALLIVGLMSTVGIYAASMTGSTQRLGGTGSVTVSAPSTTASAAYTLTSGQVTSVSVTWTPTATGTYSVTATMGGSTGTTTGVVIGAPDVGVSRTTSVTISPALNADLATAITVVINQTA
jgi:hypothetical protein